VLLANNEVTVQTDHSALVNPSCENEAICKQSTHAVGDVSTTVSNQNRSSQRCVEWGSDCLSRIDWQAVEREEAFNAADTARMLRLRQ
jgi:hypothetical protein